AGVDALSLHDALPILGLGLVDPERGVLRREDDPVADVRPVDVRHALEAVDDEFYSPTHVAEFARVVHAAIAATPRRDGLDVLVGHLDSACRPCLAEDLDGLDLAHLRPLSRVPAI